MLSFLLSFLLAFAPAVGPAVGPLEPCKIFGSVYLETDPARRSYCFGTVYVEPEDRKSVV